MANFTLQQIRGNQLQEVALTPGQTLPVQPGVIYRVKDATGAQPHRLVLRRLGRNLVVDVEGRTVLTLQDFYVQLAQAQLPKYLLDGNVPGDPWIIDGRPPQQRISEQEDLVWKLDDTYAPSMQSFELQQQTWNISRVQTSRTLDVEVRQAITRALEANFTPAARRSTATDAAGNTGTAATSSFTVDTTPPAAPASLVAPEDSNGGVSATEVDSDGGVPVTVALVTSGPNAVKPGDRITLTVTPPGSLAPVTITQTVTEADISAGSASVLVPRLQITVEGVYNLSATITDPAGNVSPAATGSFTVDLTPPTAPLNAPDLTATTDSGASSTDDNTSDNTPTFNIGQIPANTTAVLIIDGQRVPFTATVDGSGNTLLTPTVALPDGVRQVRYALVDAAGNQSAPGPVLPVTIDTQAPGAPGVAIPEAAGGVNATEAANGVQLQVRLPGNAAEGDIVTTVVTPPDGGAPLTLTYGPLTSTDLQTGTITQTVPQTDLLDPNNSASYLDGNWTTSTTITDLAGNVSQPQDEAFRLSANPPSLTVNPVTGDNVINAIEKAGSVPVTGITSAEPGQTVTVSLNGQNYTATVQPGAPGQPNTFVVPIPASVMAAIVDGVYPVRVNVSNAAGTAAPQVSQNVTIDATAPTIGIANIALDGVAASNSAGTFDALERGDINTTTVATPPTISGTTTAEAGQTVTLVVGGTQVFTTTVQAGGTWSYTLSNSEALALNHGNTYTVSASVSDRAGNPATPDADNRLVVNIAPPDIPTVNQLYSSSLTPTVTGRALKVDAFTPGNFIPLATGDQLVITLNGVTVTATIGTPQAGLSYNTSNGTWSLNTATAGSFNLVDDGVYNVSVSAIAGGATKVDISSNELLIDTTPPAITLNPISPDGSGTSVLNLAEKTQALVITGTTTAQPGATVTLTGIDGNTYTATVQPGAPGQPNTFSIPLTGAQVGALTDGNKTASVSVTNLYGLTGTDTEALRVDTTAPSAPTLGLPEAPNSVNAAEVLSATAGNPAGTDLQVTLPTDARPGDTVTTVVTKPDGSTVTLTHVILPAELPAAQGGTATGAGPFVITQTLPTASLQPDGLYNVSTTLTDTAGNTGTAATSSFTVDTEPPSAPVVSIPEAPLGISNTEALSGGGAPLIVTLPVDARPGDIVTTVVTKPDNTTVTLTHIIQPSELPASQGGTASGSGPYQVSLLIPESALLTDGGYTATTRITDQAGNTGSPTSTPFTVDRTPPDTPLSAPDLIDASDTGNSNTDNLTGDNTPTFKILTVPPDAVGVVLFVDGQPVPATFNPLTREVTPDQPLPDGVRNIRYALVDAAGNQSAPSPSLPLTIDTTPPATPLNAPDLTASTDSGASSTDNLTGDTTPNFNIGALPTGTTALLIIDGQQVLATATVDGSGNTVITPTVALPDGVRQVRYALVDGSGNQSVPSPALPVTIDTQAPGAPGVAIPEAAGGVNATEAANGVQLQVRLPGNAAEGDIITTVVTPPGGGAPFTLTYGPLTSTDLQTGTITQTVPQANLLAPGNNAGYIDGNWGTSTTITDLAGNVSQAQVDGFRLSANPPSLTVNPVTGDNVINAAEKSGSVPVTGTTSAEPGQTVTVSLNGQNYTATVQPGAPGQPNTFSVLVPSTDLSGITDGAYPVQVSVSNSAGTAATPVTQNVTFDATAPTIGIGSIAGDSVTALNSVGTFNAIERGDINSSTVATPPTIAGTTDAEAGQTVTLVLGGTLVFTTTVQAGGTWSYTLTNAQALALNHGSSYTVSASVSDLAGNPATPDTDNSLVVDIAPPDVPTVNQLFSGTLTPTLTGKAQKIDASNTSNFISLSGTDTLSVTVNGVTISGPINNLPTGLTYNSGNGTWSLNTATAGSFGLVDDGVYNVSVSATAGGATKADISSNELRIDTTPPAITLHPISPDGSGASVINAAEDGQALTLTGTTTAQPGATVTLTGIDGNTYTATVQPGAPGQPNTFSILLTGSQVSALTDGNKTASVSVTNLYGLTGTDTEPLRVDTTAPSAPTLALPEAPNSVNAAEVLSGGGTDLQVTLPADARPGDTVTTVVTKPDGSTVTLTHVIQPAELPAAQGGTATGAGPFVITQTLPTASLQPDGLYNVSTTLTDTAGNTGTAVTSSFTVDTEPPSAPVVSIPEAPLGVNNTEALSVGGTPLIVTLPVDARPGDTVTAVVTLPNGTTLTLTHTVQPTELPASQGGTASGSGPYQVSLLIPDASLVDGNYSVSTRLTDQAGNPGTATTSTFSVDRTPPAAPGALEVPENAGGGVNAAEVDSGGGVPVTVPLVTTGPNAVQPGDLVTLTVTPPSGPPVTITYTVQPTDLLVGSVSLLIPTANIPVDGTYGISTTITDPAGNISAPSTGSFNVDKTVPSTPNPPDLTAPGDTGTSSTDNLTSQTQPPFNVGTVPAGETAQLIIDGVVVPTTATVDGSGNTILTPVNPLPEGTRQVAVQIVDTAGNTSNPSTPLAVTIDTTPPAQPAPPDMTAGTDTGGSNTDNTTSQVRPDFNIGPVPAGVTPQLLINGVLVPTTATVVGGQTILTPVNPLPEGTLQVTVQNVDSAGNISLPSAPLTVTIDTTAPAQPATPDLTAGTDSGTSSTDNLTRQTRPDFNIGPFPAGETPQLLINGTRVDVTASIDGSGNTILTPVNPLPDGTLQVAVQTVDQAGNTSSPSTALTVTIDSAPPVVPTVNSQTTRGGSITLTGTATLVAGETLTVTVNGATYQNVPVNGGVWSLQISGSGAATPSSGSLGALTDGSYNVTATATDAAGNISTDSSSGELTIDALAPVLGITGITAGTDTGAPGDLITSNRVPVITGTSDQPNRPVTVTLTSGANTYTLNATTDGSGNWSVTPGSNLPEGSYTVSAVVTSGSGKTSTANLAGNLTIDSTAPAQPATPDLTASTDSGSSSTDNVTSVTQPTFNIGTVPAGVTPQLLIGGVVVPTTATVDSNGNTLLTPSSPLTPGTLQVAVQHIDTAGNVSQPSTPLTVTIDTTPPSQPAPPDLTAATDTGTSSTDNLTRLTQPEFNVGTLPAGETAQLLIGGVVVPTTATVVGGQTILTPVSALQPGTLQVAVQRIDSAGNTSTTSNPLAVTIDTTPPVAPTVDAQSIASSAITLTGTATLGPGETLSVTVNGATYNNVPVSGGTWSLKVTGTGAVVPSSGTLGSFTDGTVYNVTATAVDAAGNTRSDPSVGELTIDNTILPITIAITGITAATDSGTVGDMVTAIQRPAITGTSDQFNRPVTVTLISGANSYTFNTTTDGSGNWTVTPGANLPDGTYSVSASVSGITGRVGSATPTSLVIDATAPTLTIASASGDSVLTANSSGTFDVNERGFNATSFTFDSTVATPPVISGTAVGADGRTVTVVLNGQSYTTAVGSGTWSVTLSDTDAKALNHGTTYTITASVSDAAGNTASDIDNRLAVNIALPDVPTVVSQTTNSTTPTLTGVAFKQVALSTATETTPGAVGVAEVQTIGIPSMALTANREVTLTVGTLSLTTAKLDGTPTVAELGAALVAANGYAAAPFTVTVSGSNLVLTWKTTGVINDTASLNTYRPLEANDSLSLVIKNGATALAGGTYGLTVGGSSSPAGLTYDTGTGAWSLPLPGALGLTTGSTYNVDVSTSVTSGGATLTRNDVSSSELRIVGAPAITDIPERTSNSLLNLVEANSIDSGQTAGGTVVNVGISSAGATAGQVLTLTWGGQTVSRVITAAEVTAGTVAVLVPTSTLIAETPLGTQETISVTASINGVTSAPQSVAINFVQPTAPTINNTAWSTTSPGNVSNLSGISEALYDGNSATHLTTGTVTDNVLYQSEVLPVAATSNPGGTVVRVQLPSSGANLPQVGDTVIINWGDQTVTAPATLTSTNITTNKYIDVVIPEATVRSQPFGSVTVSAQIVSAATGNASNALPVTVQWAWDLPLASPANNQYGFAIDGAAPGDLSGYRVGKVGDFNGDGYDDIVIGAPRSDTNGLTNNGATYVVFGRPGLQRVNLSDLSAGSSTQGLMIRGNSTSAGIGFEVDGAGDVNGDGLADVVFSTVSYNDLLGTGAIDQFASPRSYVVYGTTSNARIDISGLTPAQGYSLQIGDGFRVNGTTLGNGALGVEVTQLGDINADGYDDFAVSRSSADWSVGDPTGAYIIYGTSAQRSNVVVSKGSVQPGLGFYIAEGISNGTYGKFMSGGGDINGDGYDDILLTGGESSMTYAMTVIYGGPTRNTTLSLTDLSQASTSTGLFISGPAQAFMGPGVGSVVNPAMLGDVNGDGLADFATLTTPTTYSPSGVMVFFGQANRFGTVALSAITATGGAFAIEAPSSGAAGGGITGVSAAGDFNGDGLADLLVTARGLVEAGGTTGTNNGVGRSWLVYGKTSSTTVKLSSLAVSEGFRITAEGLALDDQTGFGVAAGGDINGDGFSDLIISSPKINPDGRADAGRTYVVFGGVSDLNPMTFQASNGDLIGTTSSETLNGTAGANQIVAGDGNDTLIGNGGADVLYGGRGNDTFVLNADNLTLLARNTGNTSQAVTRVDGGTGVDTVRLTGGNLNLTTVRDAALSSIERIDLDGSNQTLTATAREVINLTGRDNIYNTGTGYTGSATGWGSLEPGNQLLVDGNSSNRLILSDNWAYLGNVQHTSGTVYKVLQSTSTAAQILVADAVQLQMPPSINAIPEATSGSALNIAEANSTDAGQSAAGTTVQVGLVGTGAVAGQVITVTWGGQPAISYTLTSSDITAGVANVLVPLVTLTAETPTGMQESISVIATVNSMSTPAFPVTVNFVRPAPPTINAAGWSATGAGNTSSVTGIGEAFRDGNSATFLTTGTQDDVLYQSEVLANLSATPANPGGTVVRVQLPTGASAPQVGDTLQLNWGSQTNAVSLVLTSATGPVDITVPESVIRNEPYGTVTVSAQIVSAASGNVSETRPVDIQWAWDLPLASPANNQYGFAIDGASAGDYSGYRVGKAGDFNGDGYDDIVLSAPANDTNAQNNNGAVYVVYGRPGLQRVNLSDLSSGGSSEGFMIRGVCAGGQMGWDVDGAGDVNGDGLADLVFSAGGSSTLFGSGQINNERTVYVVYGTTSNATLQLTSLVPSQGFRIQTPAVYLGSNVSRAGDVNADGMDDLLITYTGSSGTPPDGAFVVYGSSAQRDTVALAAASASPADGFYIASPSGAQNYVGIQLSAGGDVNGDGYDDLLVYAGSTPITGLFVVYGGPSRSQTLQVTSVSNAANASGFWISDGMGQSSMNDRTVTVAMLGDVNGDGLADMAMMTPTYQGTSIVFGKAGRAGTFSLTQLTSASEGFVVSAGTVNSITRVSDAGDFNGDGLSDLLYAWENLSISGASNIGRAWLVYGKTGNTQVNLSSLSASEGFRILGESASAKAGYSISAGGDINGDGFADLIISSPLSDPNGRADAGRTYVVFGGVSDLNPLTFQASNGDIIGTTSGETHTGTSGNNQIVAGDGNDTLIGGGGADVLYGGRGDDTFVLNASNITQLGTNTGNTSQAIMRVDGGAGVDTVRLSGGNLDLTAVRDAAITSIERIDLNGSSQTLTASAFEVINLTGRDNVYNTGTGYTATSSGGATGWGSLEPGNQLLVDGDSSNRLILSGSWQNLGTVQNGSGTVYKVLQDALRAAQILVNDAVQLTLPPVVMAGLGEVQGGLTLAEAQSSGGTTLRVQLLSTGAAAGDTVRLAYGGQTFNSAALTSTDLSNGYVDFALTTANLFSAVPNGTAGAVNTTATLLRGATTVSQSETVPIASNFIVPATPTISNTSWASTGAGSVSNISGISEALYAVNSTTHVTSGTQDNMLLNSEVATNGTVVRVQLPTAGTVAAAGDQVVILWGNQTFNAPATLTATDITNRYLDVTVPASVVKSQDYGTVTVAAQIVRPSSPNPSGTSPLNINWVFDLPLALPASGQYGFGIQGAGNEVGYAVSNAGDVNGDGLDDMLVSGSTIGNNAFLVFGKQNTTAVSIAALGTGGFQISGTAPVTSRMNGGGDVNGDGLSDLVIASYNTKTVYVVFGKADNTAVTLTNVVTNNQGYTITSAQNLQDVRFVGDVNGDGLSDMLVQRDTLSTISDVFVVYGKTSLGSINLDSLPAASGFRIGSANGLGVPVWTFANNALSGGEDVNGDGYADIVIGNSTSGAKNSYVVFGGSNLGNINVTSLNNAGSGAGFLITNSGSANSVGRSMASVGDFNGDGLADTVLSDGNSRAFVVYGKTSDTPVDLAALVAGNSSLGIMINGNGVPGLTSTEKLEVAGVGDFNGDGLADVIVGVAGANLGQGASAGGAFIVFGSTANTTVNLSQPDGSRAIFLSPTAAGDGAGITVAPAGDVNGDGFADVIIGADSAGSGSNGLSYVVFGGISDMQTMTFQASNGDAIGTSGANTLNGNSGNNQLMGGDGNDVLNGNGGFDVLYGGRGNDTIALNADNVAKLVNSGSSQAISRIDGGRGIDTLRLDGAGITLDFTQITGAPVHNIERIDLTGSGNNTVRLTLFDVLDLGVNNAFNVNPSATDIRKQLQVQGDSGDSVVLTDLANWTQASGANSTLVDGGRTYNVWNHNTSGAQLLIDNAMSAPTAS